MWNTDDVPTTVEAVNQLNPGCYGFVLTKCQDWMPPDLGDHLARYELIVHNVEGRDQNSTVRLRCIDGAYQLMDYIGEIIDIASGCEIRWKRIATYTSPEKHELPLADGISRLGTAEYWKNPFNEVTVIFDYGEKTTGDFTPNQWELIATLPEGFRPLNYSQWGMCSDSDSDNVVATYRLDYDGTLFYRASTAAVNKKSLGSIRFSFIARN